MTSESNLLDRSLESGRVHSAYLVAGPGSAPRDAALRFARAAVCHSGAATPCEDCDSCRRSTSEEEIEIDGTGKRGPLYRHIGDHADLLWVERGAEDTRVRIGQIRAVQHALRLQASEGGRRIAVIADAEWLNDEAQNALLRLLEEPPPSTTLVLVATRSSGLLATVRSRCQRVVFRPTLEFDLDDPEHAETVARLSSLAAASVPDLLDWAEEFRGPRAIAAAALEELLETGTAFLRERVTERLEGGARSVQAALAASQVLTDCRKTLAQRNANPQMVAERALLALRNASRAGLEGGTRSGAAGGPRQSHATR